MAVNSITVFICTYNPFGDGAALERVLREALAKPWDRAAIIPWSPSLPYLARPFTALPDEDLSWLGFWLIARKLVQVWVN